MALAALICGAMWTRPGVRAAAGGAWRAGGDQACREFRQGYERAQARPRAGHPTPRDFRGWGSAVLATVDGACKVGGAAGRARRAGWDQACGEFRRGYGWAQARLRAGNPTPRDFRWWVSAVLATVYGACKVCGAAGRVGHAAWQGGRDSHRRWKESRSVDAEVVNEGENPAPTAAAAGRADTTTADTTAGSTGSAATG